MYFIRNLNTFFPSLSSAGVYVRIGQSSPNPVFEEPALQPRTVRSGSQSSTGIELRSLRPGSAGSRSQHVSPQGPVPTFLSPVYPSTLRPQVPVVRPAPQLHPHMSPRMLAGRMQTHGVRPAFMRGREFAFVFKCFFVNFF